MIAELACFAPASVAGISDRKGCIRAGADADLVVIDLEASPDLTHVRSTNPDKRWAYAATSNGRVKLTVMRGQCAFIDDVDALPVEEVWRVNSSGMTSGCVLTHSFN